MILTRRCVGRRSGYFNWNNVPLNRINALRRKKSARLDKFLEKHANRQVLIFSGQWGAYWRSGRAGYTYKKEDAGIYTFEDAFDATLPDEAEAVGVAEGHFKQQQQQ